MADDIQFYVDDTSPTISYSPFGDTFSLPNLTAGWNPYFDGSNFPSTPGQTGNGTSYHVTSRDGASLSVQWKGTGIQLFGKVYQASYSITLDGTPTQSIQADLSNDILANFSNLLDDTHTIVLTTQMPVSQSQPQFFFDKALIFASHGPLANVTQHALNDSNLAYSGQWSFRDPSGSDSFHHSETAGDRAEATFQGIAFLLNGTTSPSSGRYTIILDNVSTTLSGKSSFLQRESLLFYATSLEPNVTHTLEVINEDGGSLALNVGGFGVFSSDSIFETPSPSPSPSTSLSTSAAHRKGTIAALVLGGVLFSVIFTGLLFFLFVLRPRRQRRKRLGLEKSGKQAEAGIVIDIGPEPGPNMNWAEISAPHRTSERSGFARWKREMEGGLGSLIGISFRHSGSSRGKNASRRAVDNHLWSPKSSLFSSSSKSSGRSKGKGKKKSKAQQLSGGSWSPGVAIELPARPSSADSSKGKYIDPSQDIPEGPHSVVSTLTSLSYVSSPSAYLTTRPAPPPSYSDSNSGGNTHSSGPHSVPHSVSHSLASATRHNGRENQGLSQTSPDHKLDSADRESARDRHDPPSQTPDILNPPSGEDRGNARNSSDEAASVLAAAFTQFALRGLSPRTSEFVQPKPVEPKKPVEEKPVIPRSKLRPLPEPPEPEPEPEPEPQAEQSDNHGVLDSSRDIPQEPAKESVRESMPRSFDDSFLDVLASSPFRVDFPFIRSLRQNRESGPSVRFDEESKEEANKQGEGSQDPKAKRRSLFRLTPPSGPSRSRSSRRFRGDSMSFLDFSSSSDSSVRTQSLVVSDEQEGGRRWSNLFHHRPHARWSNTATELSRNASTGAPRSVFSGNFPYPVSLPTSPHHPEGHVHPEGMTISTQQSQHVHESDSPEDNVHPTSLGVHPLSPTSPVDSVPVSVSEIQFRRHSETTTSTGSPIPPHPPLPGRDTASEMEDSVTSPLSTPNLIVQRVLGQSSTSTSTPSTPHYFPPHHTT